MKYNYKDLESKTVDELAMMYFDKPPLLVHPRVPERVILG